MADVLGQRGDGGNQPPHQGGNRLPTNCESAPPSKGRGPTQCKKLLKEWEENGRKPLSILFDVVNGTLAPLGDRGSMFSSFLGNQVRYFIPPCYKSWDKVPDELISRLKTSIQEKFDIAGSPSHYSLTEMLTIIDEHGATLYRGYKYRVYLWQLKNPGKIFRGVSVEDWEKTLELFNGEEYQAASERNKLNRKNVKYPSLQGSKSFIATRYAKRNPESGELASSIDSFEWFRRRKTGDWVNEAAENDFIKLVETRETQTQLLEASENGGEINERTIMKEVLGERRGHECGVGRIPKIVSRAKRQNVGTSRSSTGQSYELPPEIKKDMARSRRKQLKMEAYMAQMNAHNAQMNAFIRTFIQSNFPGQSVPEFISPPNFEEDGSDTEEDDNL